MSIYYVTTHLLNDFQCDNLLPISMSAVFYNIPLFPTKTKADTLESKRFQQL